MHELAPVALFHFPMPQAVQGKDPFVLAQPAGHSEVQRVITFEPAVLHVLDGHAVGFEEPVVQ